MLQRSSCWKSECHSGILFRTSGPDLHRNVFSCSCFYCLCPQDDIALEMRISRSLRLTNRIRASSGMSANNAANFCCDEMICECRDQPPEYLVRFGDPNISPCRAGKVFGVIGTEASESVFTAYRNSNVPAAFQQLKTVEQRDAKQIMWRLKVPVHAGIKTDISGSAIESELWSCGPPCLKITGTAV